MKPAMRPGQLWWAVPDERSLGRIFFSTKSFNGYTIMGQNGCEQPILARFSFILTASKIPTIQDLLGCFGVLGAPGEFVLQNAVSWLR